MTWREQNPSRNRTGSQKPHSRDIRLENFTNISRTLNTIWNEKLCGLTNKMVFQWGEWLSEYISFGGHQSQTTERIKALYDMSKCMLIIFWEKGAWNFTKKYWFLSVPSKFFYSYQLSTEQYKFFNMVIYTERFSRVLSKSNAWQ